MLGTADVARVAEDRGAALGIADRFEALVGGFLVCVPAGDLLPELIPHDWLEHECTTILASCWRPLAPSGGLVVMELVLGLRVVRAAVPPPYAIFEAEPGPTSTPSA